jgi:hypothetical protein
MEERASVMSTLSSVLEKLRQRHYDNEFSMEGERFTTENGHTYAPEDLTIILYLIEAKDGLIGYVMDVYGAASNHDTAFDDFVRQIKMEGRDEKLIFTLEHS